MKRSETLPFVHNEGLFRLFFHGLHFTLHWINARLVNVFETYDGRSTYPFNPLLNTEHDK